MLVRFNNDVGSEMSNTPCVDALFGGVQALQRTTAVPQYRSQRSRVCPEKCKKAAGTNDANKHYFNDTDP